ncbi:MAG TPA: BatA domain-containing protein [Steroidobacteraceae bacterium]|nr:BatA domain-containing protein [Steroidobacteraceae bacterium]
MGLAAPLWLLGLLTVALPLYLHLLRRSSSRPQPFASLMLFEPHQPGTERRRRLRYPLLLSLRLALLALLALAFAGPYVRGRLLAVPPDRLLVLVIDDSASMAARSGAGTRLQQAQRAALAVARSRRGGDRVQVLALDSRVHVLTQPLGDTGAVAAAVDAVTPTDARGSFALLGAVPGALARDAHTPVEIHLFSDLQATGMPADLSELQLPPGVRLVLHPVGGAAPNWTVESVDAPAQVWDPRPARIQAVIAGFGTPAATRTATLFIDGRQAGRAQVAVPAGGRSVASFTAVAIPFGLSRGVVRIDAADALPADDEYDFVMQRAERVHGLFVHQSADTRSPLYFGAAAGAASEAAVQLGDIAVQQLPRQDLAGVSFVILDDVAQLPPLQERRLEAYVRAGGAVLVSLGPAAAQRRDIPVFGGRIGALRRYEGPGQFAVVGQADAAYPPAGSLGEWSGVRFFYAARVDPAGARVGLALADGTPLLMEKRLGAGRVLLFASGFDNLTNDLPLHPVFVAFADRLLRHLAGRPERAAARTVGDYVELRAAGERGSVDVREPDGNRPLSLDQAGKLSSWQLQRAGFYDLQYADGRRDVVAANLPRLESDLRPAPPETLALWQAQARSGAAAAAAGTGSEQPRSLWWYAMAAALALVLLESVVAGRYLGTQRDAP